jgi:thiamine biosynthesis lipoprotein
LEFLWSLELGIWDFSPEGSMIHVHNHRAMATIFQVRIAGEEAEYAAQAAHVAFEEANRLENLLSRFKQNSDISAIAHLSPGEFLRVSEATFASLKLGKEMEEITEGAFSVAAAARQTQVEVPRWSLDPAALTVKCEAGKLAFDLGAIGKGFALDRMAQELADWSCPAFLLIAGGSSILAGDPPPDTPGWSIGLGEDNSEPRFWLKHGSLSGSGVAVKGQHIYDPRTGQPVNLRPRAWASAPSAAVTDALSTAFMVLGDSDIARLMCGRHEWQAFLQEKDRWRQLGGGEILVADTTSAARALTEKM